MSFHGISACSHELDAPAPPRPAPPAAAGSAHPPPAAAGENCGKGVERMQLDKCRCGRHQDLPTFYPPQVCPGYGLCEQYESPPLIGLAISQCVFCMFW